MLWISFAWMWLFQDGLWIEFLSYRKLWKNFESWINKFWMEWFENGRCVKQFGSLGFVSQNARGLKGIKSGENDPHRLFYD